ncbi:MAG: hypothetical protein AAFN70_02745, partial [Planctomycetota bacterium]
VRSLQPLPAASTRAPLGASVVAPGVGPNIHVAGNLIINQHPGAVLAPNQIPMWNTPPQFPPPPGRLLTTNTVPLPPLSMASVNLVNDQPFTLIAVLGNVQDGRTVAYTIPAGGRTTVKLNRDAGAQRIVNYEESDGFGNVIRDQIVYAIPARILYDISVYKKDIQSVAIDLTGKSPDKVEDVQLSKTSVGIFPLPPGNELPQQATIRIMSAAQNQQNPGGVRPLPASLLKKDAARQSGDPFRSELRRLLNQPAPPK